MFAKVGLGLALLVLVACQTTAPEEPATVPAAADSLFTACAPNDGAFSVRAFDGERLLGTAAAQWVARANGDFTVEVTDPLGGKLARLDLTAGRLTFDGPLSVNAPPVTVRDDGYLTVDGKKVGLKAAELPCLFGFRLPRAWKLYLYDYDIKGKKSEMQFADGFRSINLVVDHPADPKQQSSCAALSWWHYLVFKSTIDWCQTAAGKAEGSLSGLGGLQIKWVKLDDG